MRNFRPHEISREEISWRPSVHRRPKKLVKRKKMKNAPMRFQSVELRAAW